MPSVGNVRGKYTFYGLISILIWSTSSAVIRTLSEQMGIFTSGLITGLLSGLFGVALGCKTGEIKRLHKAPKSFWAVCLPAYLIYRISAMLSICTAATRQQVIATGLLRDLWPVTTMVFFLILYQAKADWRLILCITLSCFGAIIANADFQTLCSGTSSSLPSSLFAVLSSLAWGAYSTFAGKSQGGYIYFAVCMLFSGLLSGILLLVYPETYSSVTLRACIEILYSGFVVIFIATIFWNLSLRKGNSLLVICLSNYVPVITVFLSSALLGTLPAKQVVFGSILIIAGTLFGQSSVISSKTDWKSPPS